MPFICIKNRSALSLLSAAPSYEKNHRLYHIHKMTILRKLILKGFGHQLINCFKDYTPTHCFLFIHGWSLNFSLSSLTKINVEHLFTSFPTLILNIVPQAASNFCSGFPLLSLVDFFPFTIHGRLSEQFRSALIQKDNIPLNENVASLEKRSCFRNLYSRGADSQRS
jgi:hypothetical protein